MLQHLRNRLVPASLAVALALTGCSFSTDGPPPTDTTQTGSTGSDGAAAPDGAAATAAAPAGDAAASTSGSAAAPDQTPIQGAEPTLDDVIAAFTEAGLIDDSQRAELATDGFATGGYVWDGEAGTYFEIYYIDWDTASSEVKENYDLARAEGVVSYSGMEIPVDDVKGPFMVNYSFSADPGAFQQVWEEATQGLE